MRPTQLLGIVYFIAITSLAASPVGALTIDVQFASGTLFTPTSDAIAKAAINAAAADLSAAITSSLSAVTTDLYSDTVGPSTATLDWHWDSTDPFTGAVTPHATATSGADTVKIFVDTTLLFGNSLGQGGPTIGLGLGASSSDPSVGFQDALTNVAAQSQAAYTRDGGPLIGTLAGSINQNGFVGNYSVDYGVNYGNAWFDVDTDNSGARDSNTDLEDFWHFNHTTPVPDGSDKNDLYSVALHELLHVLGIGTSTSWNSQISGLNWNGSEVQSLVGSGAGLVHNDLSHIAEGTMSVQISDGDLQEAVMDPTLTVGSRKELTALDLAFLRDIGYETISPVIPNPPDYDGDGDVDGDDLAQWESSFGLNANGDTDSDGDTDGRDFLAWQQQFTGPLPISAVTAVPEPTSVILLAWGAMGCCGRRRR